jgi:peptidoglycan/xylan/chitin deacetylase (PgdA/CDA1 family)
MSAYGVMFHHFHDDQHPQVQGSISARQLAELIEHVGRDDILPAQDWMRRAVQGALSDNDICLTLDDALRCQYDVALPVLRDLGLTAFWFVYSSVFEGTIESLEVYRYFRTTQFPSIDDFYEQFFVAVSAALPNEYASALDGFDPDAYLPGFPFYTRNDRTFRYLRDDVLEPARYDAVMTSMIKSSGFDGAGIAGKLWMTDGHLRTLHAEGHVIGLHSYSHPTHLSALSPESQKEEYRKNFNHLQRVLGRAPTSMAHPCNSYGPETLRILQELGIGLGFRANMEILTAGSPFEFPREDHAKIIKDMQS